MFRRTVTNILLIYTDDQHEASVDFMPQLEDLASRGVRFRQSFVTTPACNQSRASMLTGLYSFNHGALGALDYIGEGVGAIGSDQSTIATWLQQAHYRTGYFGKYVNGYKHNCVNGVCKVPPGWDDWQATLGGLNNIYYNYDLSNNGTLESYGSEPEDYSTDVLAQKAREFVEQPDNRPFFAVLAVNSPHLDSQVALSPAPRHIGAFAGLAPWRPPSYDEDDMSDKPSLVANRHRASDPFFGFHTYGTWTDSLRIRQLEALLAVDEAIEMLIGTLEKLGEYDDTLVVFTSDNGFFWGEHRGWGTKTFPHEESIRVPLIVTYPRLIETGREDASSMVLNIDLAPTILELADAVADAPVDGRSIVPLFEGRVVPDWRRDFLIELHGAIHSDNSRVYQGVRDAAGMYAHYANLDEDELYDLAADPYQLESQASNPLSLLLRAYYQNRIQQMMTNEALRIEF